MPRLILHAGTPVAGSREIPRTLAGRREQLRAQGVFYPNAMRFFGRDEASHRPFAYGMRGTDDLQLELAHEFAAHIRDEAAEDETVVLSADSMHRHVDGVDSWLGIRDVGELWERKRRYLHNLANLFSGFDIDVVMIVGRPDRFIEGVYTELIAKAGLQQPFHRWREPRAWLCDYSSHIELLTSIFPNVSVHRDDGSAGSGVRALLSWIGLAGSVEPAAERGSPDPRVMLWLRLVRPATPREQMAFAFSDQATRLFDGEGQATWWSSLEERLAFLHRFDGPYGHSWFDAPTANGPVAELDDVVAGRIAGCWQRWRQRAYVKAVLFDGGDEPETGHPGSSEITAEGGRQASHSPPLRLQSVDEPNSAPAKHPRRFEVIKRFLQPGSVGAELGTFKGNFLDHLLSVGPERVYAVDPWYRHTARWLWAEGDQSTVNALATILETFKKEIDAGVLIPRVEFSTDFLSSLPDDALDWVYLDSTHGLDQTRQELVLCQRKVKRSGYIIGDDYQPDPAHKHYGVWRAVQEGVRAGELELLVDGQAQQFVVTTR